MKTLIFQGPGQVEWADATEPTIESPHDALVRPIAVTLCDGEVAALQGQVPAARGPYACGHEFVAEIVELGADVAGFEEGQRVSLPVQISCGTCDRCVCGLTAFCRGVRQPAAWGLGPFGGNWPGAFSDLLRIPFASHLMVPLGDSLPLASVVSLGDNLCDAYRTIAPFVKDNAARTVLIVGRGSIGLFAVMFARALGAQRVDYVDQAVERLTRAEALGAHALDAPMTTRIGSYDVVVDASLSPDGLITAVRSVGVEGVCTSVLTFQDTTLPMMEMWRRGVRLITGPANNRRDMPHVLAMILSRKVHPEQIITESVNWDDIPKALANPSMKPIFLRKPDSGSVSW